MKTKQITKEKFLCNECGEIIEGKPKIIDLDILVCKDCYDEIKTEGDILESYNERED